MKKLIPIVGLVMLAGCSSNMTKEQILAKRFEYNTKQVETTVDDLPKWFVNVPVEEGKILAVGTAKTPDLQLAVDIATLNAKTTLADSLNSRVQSQTKNFISKLGSDDVDSTVVTDIEKATKNVVADADVSGYVVRELEVQSSGTQYLVYTMLEYSDARASQVLYNRLSRDKEIIGRIRSTEAFEELEQSVEDARQADADRISALR